MAVARHAHILTRLADESSDDIIMLEPIVVVLSNSVYAVVRGQFPSDPYLLQSLDIPAILRAVVQSMQKPNATTRIFQYGLKLLEMCPLNCSDACKSYPPSLMFLIAGLQSKQYSVRIGCLRALMHLYLREEEDNNFTMNVAVVCDRLLGTGPKDIMNAINVRCSFQQCFQTLNAIFVDRTAKAIQQVI